MNKAPIGTLSSSFFLEKDIFDNITLDLDSIFIFEQHTTIIFLCGITLKFLQPKGSFL